MTKKTRQRKNLKRRSRKQSSRRKVMRQRGGALYTQADSQKKISFPRENNGEPLYGVIVVDRHGVETRREYFNKKDFLEIDRQELGSENIKNFEGGRLRNIQDNGLFYLYYEYN